MKRNKWIMWETHVLLFEEGLGRVGGGVQISFLSPNFAICPNPSPIIITIINIIIYLFFFSFLFFEAPNPSFRIPFFSEEKKWNPSSHFQDLYATTVDQFSLLISDCRS